jgi:hypothetical protein
MLRQRSLSQLFIGLGSTLFAIFYLLCLLIQAFTPLRELVAVAFGSTGPVPDLVRDNLATTGAVWTAFVLGSVRGVLMLALLATGVGLVLHLRWARWSAICGSVLLILLCLTSTVARLWFLTPPGGAVKVTPLLMDGVAILFANVLCGTMFLPEIVAAYAGYLETSVVEPDLSSGQPAAV